MATKSTAPTHEIGYTQPSNYDWWLHENETTPELIWPQSIYVYDQMRRTDSQVGSILRAVTLLVLGTTWRVDPNGARDEVVDLVSEDFGLPIIGKKPKAPPRTRDRFSWPQHLFEALLMLPLGHSYFEQVYRVDDDGSRAHLRKLALRPAKSIDRIDVAPDGGLVSIKQWWTAGNAQPTPIPVDRLVAYIHGREGGNWLGTSILRNCYKNWLLKDRLLRVQAQTIERNGMGIPLYIGQEGAEVSDLEAGKAMAKAWRAGEAAGSAIPFGANLILRGVEGTLPDAEPAIRYHDESIAKTVLAHFLNLGTQSGSWALGTTFADFFTLGVQTVAQSIADTVNKHAVEDLVDVNWGKQEPAPRIVFDEIGSRQAATAAAIKTLIDAGVIQPDDVLEESSRQQYGLPPKDAASTRQPPAPAGPSVDEPPDQFSRSVAAAAVVAKFNPSQRRDVRGRWALSAAVIGALKAQGGEAGGADFGDGRYLDWSTHHYDRGQDTYDMEVGDGNENTTTVTLTDQDMEALHNALTMTRLRDSIAPDPDASDDRSVAMASLTAIGAPDAVTFGEDSDIYFDWSTRTPEGNYSLSVNNEAEDEAVEFDLTPAELSKLIASLALSTQAEERVQASRQRRDAEVIALSQAIATFNGEVRAELSGGALAEFNLEHPRGKGGKFRTNLERIGDQLSKWSKGEGPDDPFHGFDREPLRRVAVRRGIKLRRGADRDEIAEALKSDLRVDVAGRRKAKESSNAGQRVVVTLQGRPDPAKVREVEVENRIRGAYRGLAKNPRSHVSLADLRDQAGVDGPEFDATLRRLATEGGTTPAVALAHKDGRLSPAEQAASVRFAGQDMHMVAFTDAAPRPLPTSLRNTDAGVYTEGDKVSLWEVSDSGQRQRRIALVDGLDGLEAWARDNGEPELGEWARSEQGAAAPKTVTPAKAPAKRAPRKAPAKRPSEAELTAAATRVAEAYTKADEQGRPVKRPGFGLDLGAFDDAQMRQLRDDEALLAKWAPDRPSIESVIDSLDKAESADAPRPVDVLLAEWARDGSAPATPAKKTTPAKATKPAPDAAPDLTALRDMDTEARRDALDERKIDGPDGLKALLAAEGLPKSGRKRDLVDRLVAHLSPPKADGGVSPSIAPDLVDEDSAQDAVPLRWEYGSRSVVGGTDDASPAERAAIDAALTDWVYDKEPGRMRPDGYRENNAEPAVNAAIRGNAAMTPRRARNIELLDQALEQSRTTRDATVYRGFTNGTQILPDDWNDRDLTGLTWDNNAFVSTTQSRDAAEAYVGRTEDRAFAIRVHLPKGSSAVAIADEPDGLDDEGEIILPRELTYRVVKDNGIQGDYDIRWLDVEITDNKPKSTPEPTDERETPGSILAWISANTDLVTSVGRHRSISDRRDTTLAVIGARRGYDALPQVATKNELDAAVANGWTEVWRGMRDGDAKAADVAEGFRTGEYEPGSGNYGNGYYTSAARYVAEQYRGATMWPVKGRLWDENDGSFVGTIKGGASGGLMRIAISPNARVVDLADLRKEIDVFRNSDEYYDIPATDAAVALLDPGRFAAMRGYDVVAISDRGDGAEHPPTPHARPVQYAILNRGSVMVQEAS